MPTAFRLRHRLPHERARPRYRGGGGIATVQPTGILRLPKAATLPTANAAKATANNTFGILVIVNFTSVDDSFIKLARKCLNPDPGAARGLPNTQHFLPCSVFHSRCP